MNIVNNSTCDISLLGLNVVKTLVYEVIQKCAKEKELAYQRTSKNDEIPLQIIAIINDVHDLAINRNLIDYVKRGRGRKYTTSSYRVIGEAIWELVRFGILIPSGVKTEDGAMQQHVNAFYFTEYGKSAILEDGGPIPSDPTGFLSKIKSDIPNIDDVIYMYTEESIYGYNNERLLSATITIGAASEKALLLLIEAYTSYLPTEKERISFIKKTNGKAIKRQFEEFVKSFEAHKGLMDKDVVDGTGIVINGIFELLRNCRNDAGHPTGKRLSKEEVFTLLRLFVSYINKIYDMIDYFNNNKATE